MRSQAASPRAVDHAADRYRQLVAWRRLSARTCAAFADDTENARRFLVAVAHAEPAWTDTAGRTWALQGPSGGCQISGPPAEPGAWFGGAGF